MQNRNSIVNNIPINLENINFLLKKKQFLLQYESIKKHYQEE